MGDLKYNKNLDPQQFEPGGVSDSVAVDYMDDPDYWGHATIDGRDTGPAEEEPEVVTKGTPVAEPDVAIAIQGIEGVRPAGELSPHIVEQLNDPTDTDHGPATIQYRDGRRIGTGEYVPSHESYVVPEGWGGPRSEAASLGVAVNPIATTVGAMGAALGGETRAGSLSVNADPIAQMSTGNRRAVQQDVPSFQDWVADQQSVKDHPYWHGVGVVGGGAAEAVLTAPLGAVRGLSRTAGGRTLANVGGAGMFEAAGGAAGGKDFSTTALDAAMSAGVAGVGSGFVEGIAGSGKRRATRKALDKGHGAGDVPYGHRAVGETGGSAPTTLDPELAEMEEFIGPPVPEDLALRQANDAVDRARGAAADRFYEMEYSPPPANIGGLIDDEMANAITDIPKPSGDIGHDELVRALREKEAELNRQLSQAEVEAVKNEVYSPGLEKPWRAANYHNQLSPEARVPETPEQYAAWVKEREEKIRRGDGNIDWNAVEEGPALRTGEKGPAPPLERDPEAERVSILLRKQNPMDNVVPAPGGPGDVEGIPYAGSHEWSGGNFPRSDATRRLDFAAERREAAKREAAAAAELKGVEDPTAATRKQQLRELQKLAPVGGTYKNIDVLADQVSTAIANTRMLRNSEVATEVEESLVHMLTSSGAMSADDARIYMAQVLGRGPGGMGKVDEDGVRDLIHQSLYSAPGDPGVEQSAANVLALSQRVRAEEGASNPGLSVSLGGQARFQTRESMVERGLGAAARGLGRTAPVIMSSQAPIAADAGVFGKDVDDTRGLGGAMEAVDSIFGEGPPEEATLLQWASQQEGVPEDFAEELQELTQGNLGKMRKEQLIRKARAMGYRSPAELQEN